MLLTGNISVQNKAQKAEIDIEGVIGVPEWWQFDNPEERVSSYDKFKAAIESIKKIAATEITVNIRSIGGDVNDALLILDTLQSLPATITTNCYGYVASAATIIAQAASKGNRKISENSLYLIHQGWTCACGNKSQMQESIDMLDKTDERIANIYATRSGKDIDSFVDLMSANNGNGKWLDPDEVISAGLADQIIKGSTIVNAPMDMIKVFNLPEIPQERQITNTNISMKIQKTFTAVLDFFRFGADEDHDLPENGLEKLNEELSARADKVKDLGCEVEALEKEKADLIDSHQKVVDEKTTEIANLKNQVASLENDIAKLKAKPTETEPKEDPSIAEPARTRMDAYDADVKNFK